MNGMDDFQKKCRTALIDWYKRSGNERIPKYDETFVVWCCKALQNYKCLVSTKLPDTIYAEYTYNGNLAETYEDVYVKMSNTVISDDDMDILFEDFED